MNQDERNIAYIQELENQLRAKPDQHFISGIYCNRCGRRFIEHQSTSLIRALIGGVAIGVFILIIIVIVMIIMAMATA